MKKIVNIALIIGLFSGFSVAGIFGGLTKSGTTTAQFLKIPVGARAIGMGGAYVALSSDISSIYWNPAGIIEAGQTGSVAFVHTRWLADTQFNFAAVIIHAGDTGSFGLSFTSLSMPDMKVRTEFEPEGTGEFFSAGDMAIGLSYANKLSTRFSIGANAKYINQQIWHMTASTIAFDLGIKYTTDFDWLTLGMSISNFGPKMRFEGKDVFINYDFTTNENGDSENIFANIQTDEWDLPLIFRFGLAAEILNQGDNTLLAVIEGRHPNDNVESVSVGMEYGFMQRFYLRAGYQSAFETQSEKGFTAGAGFVYFLAQDLPLMLDYAYADWNRLTSVHRFSASIEF